MSMVCPWCHFGVFIFLYNNTKRKQYTIKGNVVSLRHLRFAFLLEVTIAALLLLRNKKRANRSKRGSILTNA